VAGFMMVGTGPAQAAEGDPVELLNCDHIGGSAAIKAVDGAPLGLPLVAEPVSIATKAPLKADPLKPPYGLISNPTNCTGIIATVNGPGDEVPGVQGVQNLVPDDVGNLAKISAKFVGAAGCNFVATNVAPDNQIADFLEPLSGKLGFTYTTLDPLLKPYASSTYVRVGGGDDEAIPDELVLNQGIVTKGVGVGANLTGSFLFAPVDYKTKNFDSGGGVLIVNPNQSKLDGNGDLLAGPWSTTLGTFCIAGISVISSAVFSTDGTGLTGGVLDSELVISLPEPAPLPPPE
jgi:hypothetical protein